MIFRIRTTNISHSARAEQTERLIRELRDAYAAAHQGDGADPQEGLILKEAADELERLTKSRRRNLQATVESASPEVIERFWAKVDKSGGPDACWPWLGRCNTDGYGHVWIGGKSDKRAHRVACALVGKVQPPNTEADHTCDNRACCNPAHVRFVTHQENARRSNAPHALNAKKTECHKGHPFTEENTAIYRNGRVCLTCRPHCWKYAIIRRERKAGAHGVWVGPDYTREKR